MKPYKNLVVWRKLSRFMMYRYSRTKSFFLCKGPKRIKKNKNRKIAGYFIMKILGERENVERAFVNFESECHSYDFILITI